MLGDIAFLELDPNLWRNYVFLLGQWSCLLLLKGFVVPFTFYMRTKTF